MEHEWLMDQNSNAQEIVGRLKKIGNLITDMGQEDFNVFKTWVTNILTRSLPEVSSRSAI